MIISSKINQVELLEAIKSNRLVSFVESTIRHKDKGIKFVVDNQYYYCAMLIHHNDDLTYAHKKSLIEMLVKNHCAFGSTEEYCTLDELARYASSERLVNLLRREVDK